jgi:hypothetical protein
MENGLTSYHFKDLGRREQRDLVILTTAFGTVGLAALTGVLTWSYLLWKLWI